MNRTFTIFFTLLSINFFFFLNLANASTQEILGEEETILDNSDDDANAYTDADSLAANEENRYDPEYLLYDNEKNDSSDDSLKNENQYSNNSDDENDESNESDTKEGKDEKIDNDKFVSDLKEFSDNFPTKQVGEPTPYAVNSEFISRSPAILEEQNDALIQAQNEPLEIDTED